ncbi:helicase-related protein [Streptococcus moroccensis]|uniref:SNF2 family DNA or RNA helicase n=1 Tax=Streptococcus moroccensis TaxID=1451356 RepID=A0ABT9YQ10_9STRE|nr:helicase-related protein [Streptococcus moroccensis]MDQ0221662.1 SNF2 family DNA or RNA helicase [Streptococcus moroccensis]
MEIDNRTKRLGDELRNYLTEGSHVKMAAATFSMFAYQQLKEELEKIDELKFLFTSPTFINSEIEKQYREYTIPKRDREDSLFGRTYELKLMNELTQKTLARECANWVRRKVTFKSIMVNEEIDTGIRIESGDKTVAVDRLRHFDRKELGYEPNLFKTTRNLYEEPHSLSYLKEFEDYWSNDEYFRDVTDEILESLNLAYQENAPEFLYYVMIYNIFGDFLQETSQDYEPNQGVNYKESSIWNLLYDFQKDAVESIVTKLEKYNGCILADSVGLGKTFTALAVMTYYAYRGKRILVLCPKKLENNWNMYRHDYKNNPIYDRHLQYDVLFHTDLSRDKGVSNGIDLALNRFDTYDLVVIDESHNFRNGGMTLEQNGRENRYTKLMNQVIKQGVKTKVLMLSATPVNNRFNDLKNQLALAYEGESDNFRQQLGLSSSIDDIFRLAQAAYNRWSDLALEERTTQKLLDMLDFDFFKILDEVTIARSRKHIQEFYDKAAIGEFPERMKPLNISPDLTVSLNDISYERIYNLLEQLNLTIYQPTSFLHPSKITKYEESSGGLTQAGREVGVKKLMMINLLKRLESSIYSFRYTLVDVVKAYVVKTLETIQSFEQTGGSLTLDGVTLSEKDFDIEDSNSDFLVGKKMVIALEDMDYLTWKGHLEADLSVLNQLEELIRLVTPEEDQKLQDLKHLIDQKMASPINQGNYKMLIFSAFATTTDYLYRELSQYVYDTYGRYTAKISGSSVLETTLPIKHKDLNTLLTYFSPQSKSKALVYPDDPREIDLLIATDVISEGQNLQDCDMMVNFDIHWNPVRIIQRFGRVDRIGSTNKVIQLVNFWPNIALDDYINLKSRVEARMKISVLTATADDNVLSEDLVEDNNYRKKQLERLKEEVLDLEEMAEGVSIMDLGLEDYRRDLMKYLKDHPLLEKVPRGLQAILPASTTRPEGAIFVLKQLTVRNKKNLNNRLHPYVVVYVDNDGELVYPISEAKQLLERIRSMTKGRVSPIDSLVKTFQKQTQDGVDMSQYSSLLESAITHLIEGEEQTTLGALFGSGNVNLFEKRGETVEDFELICFFVVLNEEEVAV